MKNRNVFTIVLTVAVSAIALSALCCAEPATKPSVTKSVGKPHAEKNRFFTSHRIHITWDQTDMPLDRDRIIDLLNHPRKMSDKFPKGIRADFSTALILGETSSRLGFLRGDYSIDLSGVDRSMIENTSAYEVLKTVVEQLQELLRSEDNQTIQKPWAECRGADNVKKIASERLQKIHEHLMAEARDLMAGSDVTRKAEENRALISELEHQLRQLDIELAAKKMRLKTVQEQIAKIGREAATTRPVKDDPIAAELKRIIKLRIMESKQVALLKKQGRATALELAQAEAALADAKIRLARRREEVLRSSGNLELAARLKSEQTALVIDRSEMSVRQHIMRMQLAQARVERKKLLRELRGRETDVMKMEHVKTVDLPLAVKQYERATLRADELHQVVEVARYRRSPRVAIVK